MDDAPLDAAGLAKILFELVQPLKARLDALEGRKTMTFCGPFDPSRGYAPGNVVQKSGAAWVALLATGETPGASSHWRRIGTSA